MTPLRHDHATLLHVGLAMGALLAPARAVYESTCTWTSKDGTEFDLCGLQSAADYSFRNQHMGDSEHDSYHSSHGGRDYHQNTWQYEGYTYYVNVGKEVNAAALSSKHSECAGKSSAAAYQVHKEAPHDCMAIGTSKITSWALIDHFDPSKGVKMIYGGGEACQKKTEVETTVGTEGKKEKETKWIPTPRQTILEFICDPTQTDDYASIINMGMGVRIEEKDMCEYTVSWKTRLACPKGTMAHIPSTVSDKAAASAAAGGTTTRAGSGGGVMGWVWFLVKMVLLVYFILVILLVPENMFVPKSLHKKQESLCEFAEMKLGNGLLPILAFEPVLNMFALHGSRFVNKFKASPLLPTRMGDLNAKKGF